MVDWPKFWEMFHDDSRESVVSSDKPDEQHANALTLAVTSFQIPKQLHSSFWIAPTNTMFLVNLLNIVCPFFKRNLILYPIPITTSPKTSGKNFLEWLAHRAICYRGCREANYWWRTEKTSKFCACCLRPPPGSGHSRSDPVDIVQPTTLGLQRSFYLPETWLPPSGFSPQNLSPP